MYEIIMLAVAQWCFADTLVLIIMTFFACGLQIIKNTVFYFVLSGQKTS